PGLAHVDAHEQADHGGAGGALGEVAHGGDRGAGAALDDHELAAGDAAEPRVHALLLLVRARLVPAPVAAHEDVGAQERAPLAGGQRVARAEGGLVDLDVALGRGADPGAAARALHVVDRAVALDDPPGIEARAVELAVDVAREHERALRGALGPAAQDVEA